MFFRNTMLCLKKSGYYLLFLFKQIQLSNSNLRFAEWSWACTKMQLHQLAEDQKAPVYHYMGLFMADDSAVMDKTLSNVAGHFMTNWWDTSVDAGPPRRPRSSFEVPLPTLEVLTISDNAAKNLFSASSSLL